MVARERRAARMAPDERRAAIVDATLPLVLEHGAAVSTRLIAEAADVAEGTIYRVFPDKDALMAAVVEKAFDPTPMLQELAAVDRELPLRARLAAVVEITQRRFRRVFVLLEALSLARPPERRRRGADCRPGPANRVFTDAVVDVIGADARELTVDAAELARVLRLLVFAGTHHRISDGRPLAAAQIVTILLDGMLARPACPHHVTSEDRAC